MGFAELRKEVGVRDAGNFNYHLDTLLEHFVVKDGDEYKLTYAGMQIAGAVTAGTYTERGAHFTTETDIPCPVCDEPVTATYEYEYNSRLRGSRCLLRNDAAAGSTRERSLEKVIELAMLDARQDVERAMDGVCPHCWGPMETTVPSETMLDIETHEPKPVPDNQVWIRFDCARCGMAIWLPPGSCLVSEPPVIAFFEAHGLNIREYSYLDLPFGGSHGATLESNTPVRIQVTVELEGDRLLV
jgi:hypothetical protein